MVEIITLFAESVVPVTRFLFETQPLVIETFTLADATTYVSSYTVSIPDTGTGNYTAPLDTERHRSSA